MKTPFLAAVSAILLAGCSTNDLNRISSDVVNGAAQTVWNSAGLGQAPTAIGGQTGRTGSGSYSVQRETLAPTYAKRTSRDYGSIQLARTEKNPKNRTVLALDSCFHPGLGTVSCEGWIFAVTPEGWLVDNSIILGGHANPIELAAGTYYFKLQNNGSGAKYYVTGEFQVTPFVTNYVALQLD